MRSRDLLLLALAIVVGMYAIDRTIYITEARERKAQSEKWGQRVDQGLKLADRVFRK